MKKTITFITLLFITTIFAQSGHLMQGVSAVNMSMGGASTAQPLDINGALNWNPAAISAFEGRIITLDVGYLWQSLSFHLLFLQWADR